MVYVVQALSHYKIALELGGIKRQDDEIVGALIKVIKVTTEAMRRAQMSHCDFNSKHFVFAYSNQTLLVII